MVEELKSWIVYLPGNRISKKVDGIQFKLFCLTHTKADALPPSHVVLDALDVSTMSSASASKENLITILIALDHAFFAFAADLVGQFTCGELPQLLNEPDFSPQWNKSVQGLLRMVPVLRHFGWALQLLMLVPVSLLKALHPEAAGFKMYTLVGEERVDKVKSEITKETKDSNVEQKQSVFHHILKSDLHPSEKGPARLKSEALAFFGAGTITTATTLGLITYYVLADSRIEKRLREELKDVTAAFPEEVPLWADLEKLPYLQGCIKEGLQSVWEINLGRFFRRNVRIAPDVELQYKEWTISKNTTVGISISSMHMDPEVCPEPYKFKPDRWVGDYNPLMNRNFVPFSRGSRNCLGMNLALAELYVCIAVLFRPGGYEMSLVGTDESDMVLVHDSEVGVPKRDSKGLNVRVD
ncbi:hypothetical protein AJ79_06231 [Helicocarpus griseus UAMH5409]|uniref:Cytochrome P450 n=1 Tax=Helicocarpus griseus UAMH5409 TaxID=1447875 RepID=A0A2B7XFM6_9EURO|nr:hypothetical protein AJ79_06231 [Helicocarpus griseus UAMH5409]